MRDARHATGRNTLRAQMAASGAAKQAAAAHDAALHDSLVRRKVLGHEGPAAASDVQSSLHHALASARAASSSHHSHAQLTPPHCHPRTPRRARSCAWRLLLRRAAACVPQTRPPRRRPRRPPALTRLK